MDITPIGRRRALGTLAGGLAWAATGALGLGACADGTDGAGAPGGGGRRGGGRPRGGVGSAGGAPGGLPDVDTTMGWIEEVVSGGVRRPGYAADIQAEDLAVELFRDMGLEVHTEPVPVRRWVPERWTLTVTPAGGDPIDLDCTPLPYAAPTGEDGVELDLVRHDPDDLGASAGRAALVDAPLVRLPADAIAGFGSAPSDPAARARRVYDPDGTLAGAEHVLPHTAARNRVADEVFAAGATAFVGALRDHPIDSHRYFVPYHGEALTGPGVWIRGSDGERLADLLAHGPVRARLQVTSTVKDVTSRTIVADLPGADDDLVLIGSHHDGPWASAVEDATGTALVLAQAAHWASVPPAERPHHLRFVIHAGHMCGSAGHRAYVAEHADELDRVVLAIHLEHAGRDTVVENGETVPGPCVPRWFFTSRDPELEATVIAAIEATDLRRSLLVAPDALGENPPTDAARLHLLGVPIVQFLGAPWYLFDAADTIDKVDRDGLVPLGRAVVRIVEATAGRSAADARAAVAS